MKPRTRLLGVDFGTVRVGLAVSDPERRIASPLATYVRKNREADAAFFRRLVEDEEIGALVVGLPVHLSGAEGQKAREARAFAQWLHDTVGLPVSFADERFTTAFAEDYLLDAGLTKKRRKARLDRVAAQILLQAHLDAGCPVVDTPGPLES